MSALGPQSSLGPRSAPGPHPTAHAPNRLSVDQLNALQRDGVLAPIDLLAPDEVARYRAGFTELEARRGHVERMDRLHECFGWAYELTTHARLLDVVRSVLGDDLLVVGVLVLCKYPERPGAVPWHQDSVFSGWHLSPSISAWIALTPSTVETGCMQVIPGTHRGEVLPHAERMRPENLLDRGETITTDLPGGEQRDLVLAPGQMSLHHSNLVHGSRANLGRAPRLGFIVRFVTSAHRRSEVPVLRVSGDGDAGHLSLLTPLPQTPFAGDDVDTALARWEREQAPSRSG